MLLVALLYTASSRPTVHAFGPESSSSHSGSEAAITLFPVASLGHPQLWGSTVMPPPVLVEVKGLHPTQFLSQAIREL
jgi:hypothetical protein